MAGADEAVQLSIKQARALIERGEGGRLLRILREADEDLGNRLVRAAQRNGGRLGDRFTDARMQVYREQIEQVTQYTQARLAGMTEEQASKAIAAGVAHSVGIINAFESEFAGIAQPVRLSQAAMMTEVNSRLEGTLMRRVDSSFDRYGEAMIADFEQAMQRGMMVSMGQSEMISKLISKSPPDLARFLRENTPRHFPDPDRGYMARRYWAERIVRTETANAYNAANMASIEEARNDFDDMGKKILATFDKRTAVDSMYVHGQIRKPEENFHDGAGREYLRPPARPNDRETVIPWRLAWSETKSTRPKSLKQISDSEAAKRSSQKLPPRPRRLMDGETQKRMARTKQARVSKPKPKPKPKKVSKTEKLRADLEAAKKKSAAKRVELREARERNVRLEAEAKTLREKTSVIEKNDPKIHFGPASPAEKKARRKRIKRELPAAVAEKRGGVPLRTFADSLLGRYGIRPRPQFAGRPVTIDPNHRSLGTAQWDGTIKLRKAPHVDNTDSIKTLIHEELHHSSRYESNAYRSHGAFIEETTVEIAARKVMTDNGRWLDPLVNPSWREPGFNRRHSYGGEIKRLLDHTKKATGWSHAQTAERVTEASLRMRSGADRPIAKNADEHLENFLDSLPGLKNTEKSKLRKALQNESI